MCRVTLFNRKGFKFIERMGGLDYFFFDLEASQGGHGNGVALLNNGQITIHKGIAFGALDAADYVREHPFEWCLFHTRIASAGGVCDDNCHPFVVGDTVLAMNGTEAGFRGLGQLMGGKTDTEALLETLYGIKAPMPDALRYFDSVFMGFHNKRPFVVSSVWFNDLEMFYDNRVLIFASELPGMWKNVMEVAPKKTFYWYGGKLPIDVLIPRGESKKYYDWGNYDYAGVQPWERNIGWEDC